MLKGIFGNTTAEKVLLHIFHYGESHASGIAKDFLMALNPVIQQLNRFELAGALVSKELGRSRISVCEAGQAKEPNWKNATEEEVWKSALPLCFPIYFS